MLIVLLFIMFGTGFNLQAQYDSGKEETLIVEKWKQGDNYYKNNKISEAAIITRLKADGKTYNQLELYDIYPNPASDKANIRFFLPCESDVTIRLMSIHGKELVQIKTGFLPRGTHSFELNVYGISNGTYICRVQSKRASCSGILSIVSF